MGATIACCTEGKDDMEPGQCGQGSHVSKSTTMKCTNENCCEGKTVCEKCGCPSKADPAKLLCSMCACGEGGAASDCDDDDSLVKSGAPKMSLEYSASRDPSKLDQNGAKTADGGFKVGNEEHEDKIKATLNN